MGGGEVIREALAAGVVDELTLIIAPVVMGAGKRLFDEFNQSLDLQQFARKPETGFEPVTPCLQDRCSGQLSYSGATVRGYRGSPCNATPTNGYPNTWPRSTQFAKGPSSGESIL